ncbi:hypothetical protein BDI4_680009 [Burkholderia diffusa]|nr:hypothetical protein BDI4_680009 [Burkholderia diffusa]
MQGKREAHILRFRGALRRREAAGPRRAAVPRKSKAQNIGSAAARGTPQSNPVFKQSKRGQSCAHAANRRGRRGS